ncbi:MAG TPA: FtsX-like permease family protein [Burkholderiaceae bacterium]
MEVRPIFSALLRNKTAPLLVALQIGISLAILANALYVVQLRQALTQRPSGVAEESTVIHLGTRQIRKGTHNEILAQQQRERDALRAVPGVLAVAWTNQMPMSRSGSSQSINASRTQTRESANVSTYQSPDALVKTLGLKLVEGRDFTAQDVTEIDADNDDGRTNYPSVVIVTQALAKLMFPDSASVIGKPVYFGMGDNALEARIVGVVEHLQTTSAGAGPNAEYSAISPVRRSRPFSRWAIRVAPGQRDRVLAEAETVLRKISPGPVEVFGRTVEGDRERRYRNEKALAWMLIAVSGLLLLVTTSGIVGMTALRVTQRRKQIGVRRALGGRKIDIMRYFMTENVMISTFGIASGCALGLALNHLLVSHLELTRLPAVYLVAGALGMWGLGAVTILGPVIRAAGIPPATATRAA